MSRYEDTFVLKDKVSDSLQKINGSLNKFSEKINKTRNSLKVFNKGSISSLRSIEKSITGLTAGFRFLGGTIAAAFSIQQIANFSAGLSKAGMMFEDTKVDLEVMLGSADKAQKMFKDIQNMAIKTPFETSDLLRNTKLMLNFGIAENKVLEYTRLLGDISGGNKERFNSLALAFSQIAANGKLQGQDRLQMVNAGFNPLQELAKMTGKSMAQLNEDMSEGRISFDMVVQSMQKATSAGGRFYKFMDKRSATMSGKLSTLADTIGLWAGQTGEAINEKLKPVLEKLAPVIENMLEKIRPLLIGITNEFVRLFNKITTSPAIKILQDQWRLLVDDFKRFVKDNPEFVAAIKKITEAFLTDGITNFITSLLWLGRVLVNTFNAISQFLSNIGGAIGNLIGNIITIPQKIETAFTNMITNVINMLMPLIRLIQSIAELPTKAPDIAKGIIKQIQNKNDNRSYRTTNNNTTHNTTINNTVYPSSSFNYADLLRGAGNVATVNG